MKREGRVREDKWVRTVCSGCYGQCAIRAHVVDGVVVKIEGDPDSVMGSQGGVCGKSAAALQLLYHPKRFNHPLKRTNPEKGRGVDPKWKRISWDEALDEITEKLKKIHQENPAKFIMMSGPGSYPQLQAFVMNLFCGTFGGDRGMHGMGLHCGNASHLVSGMNHASWDIIPDYQNCNYTIQFGSNMGGGSGHSSGIAMLQAARAKARGMKTVVFDPMLNFMSGKAKEWIPIKPATDLAVALAMANVIANDLKMVDEEYLGKFTNGSYLINPDGSYVKEDGEPLVWDSVDGKAKRWDDTSITGVALEGAYEVDGTKCRTVFSFVKEHIKQYTPEWAEEISTVPAKTIRRIATEFATEARIGSTIEIDGVTLPYRPASVVQFRGAQGHTSVRSSLQWLPLRSDL